MLLPLLVAGALARQVLAGGYSVLTPVRLDAVGNPTPSNSVYAGFYRACSFVIARTTISEAAHTPSLDLVRNMSAGYLHGSKGTLLSAVDVTLKGWPGVEMRGKSPDGVFFVCRTYGLEGVGYQIAANGKGKTPDEPESLAFVGSLTLPKDTPKGPIEKAPLGWNRISVPKSDLSFEAPGVANFSEVPNPSAPDDMALRFQRANVHTTFELFLAGTIPMPPAVADQLTPEQEQQATETMFDGMLNEFQGKKGHITKAAQGERTVYSYTFTAPNSKGRADFFRARDAIHVLVFAAPDPFYGTEDEQRFFKSAKLTKG